MTPVLGQLPVIDAANAQAAEPGWRHALSLFGDVKYPADFKRFDYVNPNAPKGGTARLISLGTFDNFNIAVAGIKGNIAAAATQIYETLMAKSQDEIVTEYGLLAEAAEDAVDHRAEERLLHLVRRESGRRVLRVSAGGEQHCESEERAHKSF